jgi:hypothetical protein
MLQEPWARGNRLAAARQRLIRRRFLMFITMTYADNC